MASRVKGLWRIEKLSGKTRDGSCSGEPIPSHDPREDRTLSSIYEECRQTSELLLPFGTGAVTHTVRGLLQQSSIPRILK